MFRIRIDWAGDVKVRTLPGPIEVTKALSGALMAEAKEYSVERRRVKGVGKSNA